jgi:hypothetical protein
MNMIYIFLIRENFFKVYFLFIPVKTCNAKGDDILHMYTYTNDVGIMDIFSKSSPIQFKLNSSTFQDIDRFRAMHIPIIYHIP